jgi:hypothetical protein
MIHAFGGLGAFTALGADRIEWEGVVRTTPAMSLNVEVCRGERKKERKKVMSGE